MIKHLKEYIMPLVCAFVYFIIGFVFHTDKLFFNYPDINFQNMIIIKFLYFVFLCVMFCFGFNVYKKIKSDDKSYKRGLNIFLIYFSIVSLFAALTWPGLWSWDDVIVLERNYGYYFHSWYHILTGIFQMIFLQILPFPGGIIIIQNFIISIAVAFFIVKTENLYNIFLKNKIADITIKILPFLLFPILRYQLSGYRIGLYIFFELTFLCMALCTMKEKKEENIIYIALFTFVCAISAVWGNEGLIYLPVGIAIILTAKHLGNIRKRINIISVLLIMYIFIFGSQLIAQNNENIDIYKNRKITAFISQTAHLAINSDKREDKKNLSKINKVIDLETVYKNPEKSGIKMYWEDNPVRKNISEKDFKDFLVGYVSLVFKYPEHFYNERYYVVNKTLYNEMISDYEPSYITGVFENKNLFLSKTELLFNKPLSDGIRNKTAKLLYLKKLLPVIWNGKIPLAALIVFLIIMIKFKRFPETLLTSAVLIKQFAIMLTQPEPNFQYCLSIYLIGNVIIFYALALIIINRNKIKSSQEQ